MDYDKSHMENQYMVYYTEFISLYVVSHHNLLI
ncbi:hypothetical protein ABIC86_001856 [Paenibacillus sp. DS2363]